MKAYGVRLKENMKLTTVVYFLKYIVNKSYYGAKSDFYWLDKIVIFLKLFSNLVFHKDSLLRKYGEREMESQEDIEIIYTAPLSAVCLHSCLNPCIPMIFLAFCQYCSKCFLWLIPRSCNSYKDSYKVTLHLLHIYMFSQTLNNLGQISEKNFWTQMVENSV